MSNAWFAFQKLIIFKAIKENVLSGAVFKKLFACRKAIGLNFNSVVAKM